MTDPEQIDPEKLAEITSTPVAPPAAHGAAIVALLNVARTRDDIAEPFVEHLGRLLGRPSLETPLVLRCLRELARNDPAAVLELRDEISDRISTDSTDVTQAATGVCVELVNEDPSSFVDLVPTLAALLESENEQIRKNSVYILSEVAHEYPEQVKPVVPQLTDGVVDRDRTYQTNALSALGAIVSSYPTAGTKATETLADIADSTAPPKVRANAIGLLGDVAVEYPDEIVDHVPVLVDCLQSNDEFVTGNAAAAILHIGAENPDAAEDAIPALAELTDHSSPVVRRNTCRALGQLNATVALEQLKSTAESDPDETVRSVAAQAVDRIS
ncbi:HEAT repeat domain-containing protein [Natronobacterium texcoconense]|uniref:HEAT repeat domain-containing protein n=1 Tax=Natronobacterium texcoconense TaxID=1095778 RepID=UPI00147D368C|nr:HEAT repeat domain-containing protein [Natronobacterium texcoconense]